MDSEKEQEQWSRRKFITRTGLGVAGVTSLGALLAACDPGEGEPDVTATDGDGGESPAATESPSESAATEEDFLLGVIVALTGPLAGAIAPNYAGLGIAVEEINAAGGIAGRQIRLERSDDEYDPSLQPVAVRRLDDRGVKYIAGPTGSSNVEAALPVTTPAKIITHGWAKTDSQADPSQWPYNFPLVYSASTEGTMLARQMLAAGAENFGIVAEQTLFGETLTEAARREFEANGKSLGEVVEFPLDAPDVRPFLQNVRDAGADSVGLFTVSSNAVTQAAQGFADLGWFPAATSLIGPWNENNLPLLPPEMEEQFWAVTYRKLTYTDDEPISDEVRSYAEKIQSDPEAAGAAAGATSANFYDFVYMLKQAIESAGTDDTDAVREELEARPFEGVLGTYELSDQTHSGFGPDQLAPVVVASLRDEESFNGAFARRASN